MSADLHALRVNLRTRLSGMSEFPGDDHIAAENRPFKTPEDDSLWLRENLVYGDEILTSSRMTMMVGIYWLFVNSPAGKGTEDAEDLSKKVAEAFPIIGAAPSPGLQFYRVTRQPGRLDASGQGVWFTIPVLVYFRLFTAVT